MSAAPKKNPEELSIEAVDVPSDREQKLSNQFEDPALDQLIPGLGGEQPDAGPQISLVAETADAVHELLQEASAPTAPAAAPAEGAVDLSDNFGMNLELGELPLPEAEAASPEPLPILESAPMSMAMPAEAEPVAELAPPAAAPVARPMERPNPLPASVNPQPDPLDRSVLLQIPQDSFNDASTILNAGQIAEAARDTARIDMAHQLFELVACEKTFDNLVLESLQVIMGAVGGFAGSVLEVDHEKEDFFFRASAGGTNSNTTLKAFRVPLTKGIVGHVAETGQPLLIRNLEEDKMQMRAISASVGFDARTCMAAPIVIAGQAYGVIEIFNKIDGNLFTERDLAVLEDGVKMLTKVLEVRFLLAELSRRPR